MYACQEGHEHVVEALLNGGATVDIQLEVTPSLDSWSHIPTYVCNVNSSKLPCIYRTNSSISQRRISIYNSSLNLAKNASNIGKQSTVFIRIKHMQIK